MTRELLVGGPASVQSELLAHFVSIGEANRIAAHEAQHSNADTEGSGIFGVVLAPATISFLERNIDTLELIVRTIEIEIAVAAFYMPLGDRSPETLARIAAAPGFSDMSGQDWKVYQGAIARDAWQKEQERRLAAAEEQEENWVVVWQRPKDEKKAQVKEQKETPTQPIKTPV